VVLWWICVYLHKALVRTLIVNFNTETVQGVKSR
jgi:hypothetical protein